MFVNKLPGTVDGVIEYVTDLMNLANLVNLITNWNADEESGVINILSWPNYSHDWHTNLEWCG